MHWWLHGASRISLVTVSWCRQVRRCLTAVAIAAVIAPTMLSTLAFVSCRNEPLRTGANEIADGEGDLPGLFVPPVKVADTVVGTAVHGAEALDVRQDTLNASEAALRRQAPSKFASFMAATKQLQSAAPDAFREFEFFLIASIGAEQASDAVKRAAGREVEVLTAEVEAATAAVEAARQKRAEAAAAAIAEIETGETQEQAIANAIHALESAVAAEEEMTAAVRQGREAASRLMANLVFAEDGLAREASLAAMEELQKAAPVELAVFLREAAALQAAAPQQWATYYAERIVAERPEQTH